MSSEQTGTKLGSRRTARAVLSSPGAAGSPWHSSPSPFPPALRGPPALEGPCSAAPGLAAAGSCRRGWGGWVQKHSGLAGGFTGLLPGQRWCSAQHIFESIPQMAVVQIFVHGVCGGDHSDMYEKIKANFSLFYITTID